MYLRSFFGAVMVTKLCQHAKHYVTALLLVAIAGIVLAQPKPAAAIWWAPPPPTPHRDARWIEWKPAHYAYYQFAFEYTTRLSGPPYQGLYPYARIYVYDVQNVFYPYGLLTVGRAEKVHSYFKAR